MKNINKIKNKILPILKKHNVKKAGIFGSYARGEEKKNSDIDILIQPTKDMSLFDIVGIEIELKNILGKKVDLLTYKSINRYIKKYILNDEVKII
ncbi:MAG: nucleotidyltransferase family protein [Nanoarchaeota archaeon]|nr:nucleotidyltransferase family protein [Nanoarchaeota archaeon]MBU4116614.1 nucleotidyltransferase family protein [Nanoarchaeota archaeon]